MEQKNDIIEEIDDKEKPLEEMNKERYSQTIRELCDTTMNIDKSTISTVLSAFFNSFFSRIVFHHNYIT